MYRRISFIGGPGSGKSTTAPSIFSKLKKLGFNVEQVLEAAKKDACENRVIDGFYQNYIFATQMESERFWLENGKVDVVVSDSPLPVQYMYAKLCDSPVAPALLHNLQVFEAKYPSMNIFLDRTGLTYQPHGRYQKTVEEAIEVDNQMKIFLKQIGISYWEMPTIDEDRILSFICKHLS